jgi:hypothetical protein
MEGRVLLTCGECGRTREISGEIPREYTDCFAQAAREDGWVPRPGAPQPAFVCGACLAREFAGHETVDDGANI